MGVWAEAPAETIRQPRDRLKRHPQERQHSAAVCGGTRDRVPPARGAASGVGDGSRKADTACGIGSRQPAGQPVGGDRDAQATALHSDLLLYSTLLLDGVIEVIYKTLAPTLL